jgi:hypothetical protein
MKQYLLYLLPFLFLFNHSQAQTTFQKTFGSTGSDYATDVIQTADKGYAVMGVMNFGGVYILKTDSLGNKQWSKNIAIYNPSAPEFSAFSQTADGGFILAGRIYYSSNYYGFTVKLDASGNVTWSKMHTGLDRLFSIKQTIEGDYIAVGNRTMYFGYRGTIVKFNSAGNIIWSRSLPVNNARDVIQLASDSSFITCYYANNPTDNINISRWSKNANLMWSKTLNNPKVSSWNHGRLHENGNEVQIALNTNNCQGLFTIHNTGTNAKMIGVACPLFNYYIADAFPTANKGSILVAEHNGGSPGYGTRNIVLISIDSTGTVKWGKQIGGVNDEAPASVKQTKDKGIVIAGTTKSFSAGKDDIYLVKTDSLGQSGCNTSSLTFTTTTITATISNYIGVIDTIFNNITSQQSIPISSPAEVMYDACVCVAPVASFTPSTTGGMAENSTWASNWYWTCTCMPGVIDSTVIDKSYYGGPFANGTYTVCLKVKNSCGVDSVCHPFNYTFWPIGVEENIENTLASFYPNPVTDKMIISRSGSKIYTEVVSIRILNSLGALVYSDKMEGALKEISFGGLAPGLYFIQFSSGNKTVSRKVIKE